MGNLPEAFKTALAPRQKREFQPRAPFYLSFYAAHFLLGCISRARTARVSSQRGNGGFAGTSFF